MENKKRFISCGKCNKKFCFINLAAFIITIILIVPLRIVYYFKGFTIDNKNNLNILSYLFCQSLGEFLMIIPELILKKTVSSKKEETIKRESANLSIEYIFNQNSINFSFKEKIIFCITAVLKPSVDFIGNYINFYFEKDKIIVNKINQTFYLVLIFIFLLAKKMYNLHFYKHQYLSITIITLSSFTQFIINYYQEDVGRFFLHLLLHLIKSFLKALLTVYISGLMKYKYFTPYKVCYLYGLINLIIVTIIYAIFSFFQCEEEGICILDIFTFQVLIIFIFLLLQAISLVLSYIIIDKYSICHAFIIYQFNQFSGTEYDFTILQVISVALRLLDIFFILVFLEFIEINICKISYNTKLNIENRASKEIEFSSIATEEDTEEDEIEEESESQTNEKL